MTFNFLHGHPVSFAEILMQRYKRLKQLLQRIEYFPGVDVLGVLNTK